jgi:formate dehydrogenase major subunit
MQVSRRQFFKICAGGMAGTTAAALGFAPACARGNTAVQIAAHPRNP